MNDIGGASTVWRESEGAREREREREKVKEKKEESVCSSCTEGGDTGGGWTQVIPALSFWEALKTTQPARNLGSSFVCVLWESLWLVSSEFRAVLLAWPGE